MPVPAAAVIISLCLIFLLASIFSDENVRFGYVLVPLFAALFWFGGFLPYTYLATTIPILIFMGVIGFMRGQLKYKWGFVGTSSGILIKLVFFLIVVQLVIGYTASIGMFTDAVFATPVNDYSTYTLENAEAAFGEYSSELNITNVIANSLMMVWAIFIIIWNMMSAVFCIAPFLWNNFGLGATATGRAFVLLLQAGIYVIYGLELFNMYYRPYKPLEV